MNKYEFIKSIGFRLEPVQADNLKKEAQISENKSINGMSSFIKSMEDFTRLFSRFLFKENNTTYHRIKVPKTNINHTKNKSLNDIYIKKQWLKNYTQSDFFHWLEGKGRQTQTKYLIRTIPYLYPSQLKTSTRSEKEYSTQNHFEQESFTHTQKRKKQSKKHYSYSKKQRY